MLDDLQAAHTACPECARQPNEPCVILPDFAPLLDRFGKPCFHPGRYITGAEVSGERAVKLDPEQVRKAFETALNGLI